MTITIIEGITAVDIESSTGGGRGPQIVTTRGCLMNTSRKGTDNSRTDLRLELRNIYYVGNQAVSQLQVANPGFIMNPNGETALGNDYNWEVAFENISPSCYQSAYIYGANLATVLNGCPMMVTYPPVGYDIAAGGSFYIREAFSIANDTLSIPGASGGTDTHDGGYISPATVSQIQGTGALSNPSGGTSYGTQCPSAVLGIPAAPMASVIYVGDSIPDGTGDVTDGNGNLGFIARGLWSVNSYPVPWSKQTIGSWSFAKATVDKSPGMRSFWGFATHIIIALGTNDIAGNNSNLAAMQTFVNNMCTAVKRTIGPYGIQVKTAVCTLMPRTTSTDSWATSANQAPVAHFGVGETRETYNTWLLAQAGNGLIDAVIDVNPYVADPSTPSVWLTNGAANYPTIDGVHPSSAFHILAATAVNNWALGISPT